MLYSLCSELLSHGERTLEALKRAVEHSHTCRSSTTTLSHLRTSTTMLPSPPSRQVGQSGLDKTHLRQQRTCQPDCRVIDMLYSPSMNTTYKSSENFNLVWCLPSAWSTTVGFDRGLGSTSNPSSSGKDSAPRDRRTSATPVWRSVSLQAWHGPSWRRDPELCQRLHHV